ncbi:hypothetical protein ACFQ9J_28485 [Streptomyces sp. NPDC056529]|uniref:hypothetical protein n=1 Tax=Streptomyces sp. NPDC056529 TaxID=3345855 RepID=UPI0036C67E1C
MADTLLDPAVRDGLRTIADQLTHTQPGQLMDPTHRLHLARTHADHVHPDDLDAAVELERSILRRMPFIEGLAVTRGEYALWLHKTSWGA